MDGLVLLVGERCDGASLSNTKTMKDEYIAATIDGTGFKKSLKVYVHNDLISMIMFYRDGSIFEQLYDTTRKSNTIIIKANRILPLYISDAIDFSNYSSLSSLKITEYISIDYKPNSYWVTSAQSSKSRLDALYIYRNENMGSRFISAQEMYDIKKDFEHQIKLFKHSFKKGMFKSYNKAKRVHFTDVAKMYLDPDFVHDLPF